MIFFVVRELIAEMPLVIVCIGGIVAAIVLWKKAPSGSVCVILACGFTLTLLVAYPAAWWFAREIGAQTQSGVGAAFKMGWSVARSISTLLLVVAVYTGRKTTHEDVQA
jgi:hypothetical protein